MRITYTNVNKIRTIIKLVKGVKYEHVTGSTGCVGVEHLP